MQSARIDQFLAEEPNLVHACKDVNMTITTESVTIVDMDDCDVCYVVVTCAIILFQSYFSLRRPSEIILSQRVETCLKLFQDYFRGLRQLTNIF